MKYLKSTATLACLCLYPATALGQGIGTAYCTPNPNSTGSTGLLEAFGNTNPALNNVTLQASNLPNFATGFGLVSQTQGFVMNPAGSAGNLCVVGSIGRYVGPGQIFNTGTTGTASLALDLTSVPQPTSTVAVAAGDTWNFQFWHRDSIGGVVTSNFTNGVEIFFDFVGGPCTIQGVVPTQAQGGDLVVVTIAGLPAGTDPEDVCMPGLVGVGIAGDQWTAMVMPVEPMQAGPIMLQGALGDGLLDPNPVQLPGVNINGPVTVIEVPNLMANTFLGGAVLNVQGTAGAKATPWQLVNGDLKSTLSNDWVQGDKISLELHFDTNNLGIAPHCDFFTVEVEITAPNPTANSCALLLATHLQLQMSAKCPAITVNVINGTTICVDVTGADIINNHSLNKIVVQ